MNEKQFALVLGGTRSGKSHFAEELAKKHGSKVLYIATATVYDDEMLNRVREHQARRPELWDTKEEPINVIQLVNDNADSYDTILLDCLTLWLTNLILADSEETSTFDEMKRKEALILDKVKSLAEACSLTPANIIIVSNEVGLGIVPESPLGRLFRDIAGNANQIFAQWAQEVYFVAAGLPLTLKS